VDKKIIHQTDLSRGANYATLRQMIKLVNLRHKSIKKLNFNKNIMTAKSIACRLRTLRRKSGLSQSELAKILGLRSDVPVSLHEHSATAPSLESSLGYAIVFRVPVSEIFPGIFHVIEKGIEERLEVLEKKLHESTAKGRNAEIVARKLEFLCERKIEPSK
jgi:DNA-binding XRE family transcriptional regulator